MISERQFLTKGKINFLTSIGTKLPILYPGGNYIKKGKWFYLMQPLQRCELETDNILLKQKRFYGYEPNGKKLHAS